MTSHELNNKSAILKEEKRWNSKKGKRSNSHKKENSFLSTNSKSKYKANDFSNLFFKGHQGIGLYNPKQRQNSKHNQSR